MKKTILSVAVATTLGLTMGAANAYGLGGTPVNSMPTEEAVKQLLEDQNFTSGQELLDFISGEGNMTTEAKVVMVNAKLANYVSEDGQTVQLEWSEAQEGWKLQRRDSEKNQDDSFFLEDGKGSWQDPYEKAKAIEQIEEYGKLKHTPIEGIEQKIKAFNGLMDKAGKDTFIQKDPMTDAWTLYRGNGEAPVKLTKDMMEDINTGLIPVKVEAFNQLMDKAGKDTFIQKDPMTGKWTIYRSNGEAPVALTEDMIEDMRGGIASEIKENLQAGINPPADVIVDPITPPTLGGQTTKEQQAGAIDYMLDKFYGEDNKYKANIVDGTLEIVDADGNVVVENNMLKPFLRDLAEGNNAGRVDPIEPPVVVDPILPPIESPEPIAGNPDAIKAFAKDVVLDYKANASSETKFDILTNAATKHGFSVDVMDKNANDENVLVFTDYNTGEQTAVTVDQFNEWMLSKHDERKAEREFEGNDPINGGSGKGREALDNMHEQLGMAKDRVEMGADSLQRTLKAGKSELEAAAQSATEQMAAQFAAMQAQLDEQAKLIAELQAGENPSVPSTGISPEAESALRDVSATLQAKMDVAVNKLQGAAKTLQEKGSKLAPQDPDFGINPPSQGVPTHELGSIGEGQAVAYVQNGLEELYNTGNEQAQQYADKALSDAKSYTDTQIAGINSRIDGIEEDLETVMATSQAVTAARPYLSSNQTNAIGVGLGNSGSQNAIAVGYAHRINENWTANANLSGTSGNEVDYSVGAGLSYAW
ncbi:exported hypothetical protein [Vibrio owensii]|uniref:YadA C-terminal domain-containing protein n=1 Tax=Vibrio owensii TaxID=696485 RepID=UPI00289564D7|nr:exported hypothetical protein [Vibrio owensii]CAH1582805.1 exported hypothetical protein [Vibrio owensii]